MNILADQISDSLSGKKEIVIKMNELYYTIKPPKTKLLALMLKPLSQINISDFDDKASLSEVIKASVDQYPYMDECTSLAILGDKSFGIFSVLRLWRMKRRLSFASDTERLEAFKQIVSLIIPTDFFAYARLAMELTGTMANGKQK